MAGIITRLRDWLFRGGAPDTERVEPAPPSVPAADTPEAIDDRGHAPAAEHIQRAEDIAAEDIAHEPAEPPEAIADEAPMPVDAAVEAPGAVTAQSPELSDPVVLDEDPQTAVRKDVDAAVEEELSLDDGLVDLDMVESDFLDLDIAEEPQGEAGAPVPLPVGSLIAAWRSAVDDPERRWAVFANGTAVMLEEGQSAEDAAGQLAIHGLVTDEPGSAARRVVPLADGLGWVVASRHPAILTYIAPDEAPGGDEETIGEIALLKRDADARAAVPVHVEG